MGHVVDPDMVGVAVAAVPVVADDDVGVLLVEDRGEPAGRLVEVGPVQEPSSSFCAQPVMPESE